ncbi:hypothetical protein L1049_026938 [Liquidambar formosana]|uniref:WPP domain-containing protein n=1 Tax=Liquidambar formosana TaxID=63359 RepID=A0AAP0R8F8_LIQFO
MSDTEDGTVTSVVEETSQATAPTMAESQDPQHQQQQDPKKLEKMNISFSIWPPTQRTRDAVINRLIETLSTPSVLSKRYGTMPADEASAAARLIEEQAFLAAGGSAGADDDGIEVLQVYSKEISKRMLEAVKSRAASGSTPDNGTPQTPVVPPTATSEEVSSVETESS